MHEEVTSGAANHVQPHQLTVCGQMFLQLWKSAAQNHEAFELGL